MIAIVSSGCASTGKQLEISESCEHFSNTNAWGQNTKREVEILREASSRSGTFYEPSPSKIFSSITSIQFNNATLAIKIQNQGFFDEYSAPVIEKIRQVTYEAHRLTGSFTPVGSIVWLFNPKLMNDYTFGCTEREKLDPELDKTKKIKTGNHEWKEVEKNHKILISGFDKEYEFTIDPWTKEIDLTQAIFNSNINKNTTINVKCLSCDLLGDDEKKLYPNSKNSIQLNSDDLLKLKNTLTKNQKNNPIEKEISKESTIQKDTTPLTSNNVKHESVINNLDEVKNKKFKIYQILKAGCGMSAPDKPVFENLNEP